MAEDTEHARLSIGRPAALGMVGLAVVGLMLTLAFGVGACTDLTQSDTGTTTATLGTTVTSVTSTGGVTTSAAAANPVSQDSRDYALSLGGTSHKGEKLYFVIGASVKSEKQAQALLEPAKAVGDMQSYFVVQLSDNFDGMTPGYWVVFEAYREYPSQENIDFGRRPFPDAYVKSAVVLTDDPLPVYEDMLIGE